MPAEQTQGYAPPTISLVDLMRVHPTWLRHRDEWIQIRDVTTGALGDKRRLERYLPRAKRESDSEYAARVAMTEFVPECLVVRERIIGALYSVKPTRELDEQLTDWTAHVDHRRQSLDHFLETQVMPPALDFGAAHVLVDRLSDGGAPPADRAEQERRKLLWPFLAAYSPLEVRQWEIGEEGALLWALIVEEGWHVTPETGQRRPMRTYRRFDRTGWAKWVVVAAANDGALPTEHWSASGEQSDDEIRRGGTSKWVMTGPTFGAHGSPGVVPLVSFIPSRIEELVGRSIVGPAARLDLKLARLDSDRTWDLYVHAHPYLVAKTDRQLAEIGVGSNEFMKLRPDTQTEKEDAKYLDLPTESFAARERAIADTRTDIYRHLGIDPLGVVTSAPSEASGVARAWSFSTSEARHLGRLGDRVEDCEMRLLEIVASYAQIEPPKRGAVKWPETFETAAPTQLIEDAIAFRQACRSDTAQRLVEKRLALHIVGEVSSEVSKQIETEIDGGEATPFAEPSVVVAQ
jgi:hypothetical protein